MPKRAFANLVESVIDDDTNQIFGNFDVASNPGQPRQVARSLTLPTSDVLNHLLPTLSGTVIEAKNHPSPKMTGQVVITALISDFRTPESSSPIAYELPSGIGVMPVLTKLTSSAVGMDKVAKPHVISDTFGLVPITGIVNFTVRSAKNGRNGTDLRPEDLPPGVAIEALRYVAEAKMGSDGAVVYCSADSISILSSKPGFVTSRAASVVQDCFQNKALHREEAVNVCRGVGEGQHQILREWLEEDCFYLKPKLMNLIESLKDRKVGIGKPFESDAMSAEALASVKSAIEKITALEDGSKDDKRTEISATCDAIEYLSKMDVSSQRYAAHLHAGITPQQKMLRQRRLQGMGPMAQEFAVKIKAGEAKGNFFTESLVEAGKEPSDKSIGCLEFNFNSTAIWMRSPRTNEWVGFTPKLKDGTAVCIGQLLQSGKKVAAPALGVYDFWRLPMVAKEVAQCTPILAVLKRMPLDNTKLSDVQVQPLTGGDFGVQSVVDYASGVLNAGVVVSKKFVEEHLCDHEEVKVMTARQLFGYVEVDASGDPKLPSRPRFVETGFNALNAHEEVRLHKYIEGSNNPRGTDKVNFMVVYEGVYQDLVDEKQLSNDTAKGDELVKRKIEDDKKFSTEKMVLFAIATEKDDDDEGGGKDKGEGGAAKKKKSESDSE